ncbi:MAG: hypothetical protein Q8L98_05000 [Chlamydiales bacterium]|nr:hypothetical protein [Chlamydiales bacterium]
MFDNLACRVCGYIQDEPPWGEDGQCPNYIICACCGVEFGYGDCSLEAIKSSRKRWFSKGANWKYPKEKPENWSLEEHLKDIPLEYRE